MTSEPPTKAVAPNTGHEATASESMGHHVWDEIIATPGGLTAIGAVVIAFFTYMGVRHKFKRSPK